MHKQINVHAGDLIEAESATSDIGWYEIIADSIFPLQPPQSECRDARPAQIGGCLRCPESISRAGRSEYARVPFDVFQLLQVLNAPQSTYHQNERGP